MKRVGRESAWIGIAAVCLDVGAALIILAWDVIEQFFKKLWKAIVSGIHQLRVALSLGHVSAFFRSADPTSSIRAVIYALSEKRKE